VIVKVDSSFLGTWANEREAGAAFNLPASTANKILGAKIDGFSTRGTELTILQSYDPMMAWNIS